MMERLIDEFLESLSGRTLGKVLCPGDNDVVSPEGGALLRQATGSEEALFYEIPLLLAEMLPPVGAIQQLRDALLVPAELRRALTPLSAELGQLHILLRPTGRKTCGLGCPGRVRPRSGRAADGQR